MVEEIQSEESDDDDSSSEEETPIKTNPPNRDSRYVSLQTENRFTSKHEALENANIFVLSWHAWLTSDLTPLPYQTQPGQ